MYGKSSWYFGQRTVTPLISPPKLRCYLVAQRLGSDDVIFASLQVLNDFMLGRIADFQIGHCCDEFGIMRN